MPASELASAMKQIKAAAAPVGQENHGKRAAKSSTAEYGRQKVDSARPCCRRMANKPCQSLPPVSRIAQLHAMARRSKDWQDRRCKRKPDDTGRAGPYPYRYRRSAHPWLSSVWALLRRQSETDDMAVINAKRVYRIMRQNALLLERKPEIPPSKRAHTGKVAVGEKSNQRWCSDGFRVQL